MQAAHAKPHERFIVGGQCPEDFHGAIEHHRAVVASLAEPVLGHRRAACQHRDREHRAVELQPVEL